MKYDFQKLNQELADFHDWMRLLSKDSLQGSRGGWRERLDLAATCADAIAAQLRAAKASTAQPMPWMPNIDDFAAERQAS